MEFQIHRTGGSQLLSYLQMVAILSSTSQITPSSLVSPDPVFILDESANGTSPILIGITFCGDWAGNSYANSGCPGTCTDRLMDPGNFVASVVFILFYGCVFSTSYIYRMPLGA